MSQVEWMASAQAAKYPSAPLWNPQEKRLYWCDIETARLFRLNPDSGEVELILDDGRSTGAMILRADGSLMLFREGGEVSVMLNGAIVETLVAASQDFRGMNFSCAAADSCGCVVCATHPSLKHLARLCLLKQDGKLRTLCEMVGTPAGLTFADEGSTLLLSNSYPTRAGILRFSYDASAEDNPIAGASTKFLSCYEEEPRLKGVPCGMATLADGSIVVARSGGSIIARYTPSGDKICTHGISVKRPIGLCIGGEGLADLFITTAGAHRLVQEGTHAGEIAIIRDFQKGNK